MGLSKKTRFDVFKRDLFTCQYCGRRPPDVVLQVDHIIAKAKDGSDDPDNLTTSCDECNQGKSDRSLGNTLPIVDEMQRLEAIQEMQERAALLQSEVSTAVELRAAEDVMLDALRCFWEDKGLYGFRREDARMFVKQLAGDQLMEAVDATANKRGHGNPWRYFCACCWKMIRGEWEGGGHVPNVPSSDVV